MNVVLGIEIGLKLNHGIGSVHVRKEFTPSATLVIYFLDFPLTRFL
jgi:hypothetical protein